MTQQRSLKQRIRARMKKTGERYTAARAHLLGGGSPPAAGTTYPGLLPGYDRFGGVQSDTAILRNVLAHAGVRHPATGEPYTEEMIYGLCGGVGFLYAVFEYAGFPPMLTVVARSRSMPSTFVADVFERVGVTRRVSRTGSDRVAEKALDEALAAGQPAVCIVDVGRLPHTGVAAAAAGMGPHHVAVVGADGERVWLDDRALRPVSVARAQLAAARAAYGPAKRSLFTVEPAGADHDWRAALRAALADTARTLREGDPTVPKSFRVNCGLSGMEKWRRLLTDAKDKKGWPTVFADGERAFAGLRRAYDCLQHDYTSPGAGRPFYADFLDEAATLLDVPDLRAVAADFRASGAGWRALADQIAAAPDDALQRACKLCDRRAEALDEGRYDELPALHAEAEQLRAASALTRDATAALYASLAATLDDVIALERAAVERLGAVVQS